MTNNLDLITLPNGLPLLKMQTPGAQISSALFLTRAGSRFETQETDGLTRFYSIMALKRTRGFPQQLDLLAEVDRIGGFINVEANREYTAIYVKAFNPYFADALRLLGEVVVHPHFDPGDIEAEKQYFLTEIQNRFSDQNGSSIDELFKKIFPDQALAYSGVGSKNAVQVFTDGTLHMYRDTYYTGLNSSLILNLGDGVEVTGQLDEHLNTYFGALPQGQVMTPAPVSLSGDDDKSLKIPTSTGATSIAIGFPAYSRTSPHRHAQLLIETMLAKTKSNTRFANISVEEALARSVGTSLFQFTDGGVFVIQAFGESKTSAQAHQRVLDEIEKISMVPVSEEELARAQGYYAGMFMLGLHDPVESSFFYGLQMLLDGARGLPGSGEGALKSQQDFTNALQAVSVDEIQGVAQQIFNPGYMFTVLIGE